MRIIKESRMKENIRDNSIEANTSNTKKKVILPGPMTPRLYSQKPKKTENILKAVL